MSKKYFLAVDAGTGSVRAVLFDLEGSQTHVCNRNGSIRKTPGIRAAWILTGIQLKLTCGCIRGFWNNPALHRLRLRQSPPPA